MPPADSWHATALGSGVVDRREDEICLKLPPATASTYHDAQISDYQERSDFRNRPPLRLSVRARAEGTLRGTAGFGFWNDAFVPGRLGFRVPQAIWFFFGSPPNDIALAKGVAGYGWKAATFNARNWRFMALLPFAPIGFVLMRNRALYNAFWPLGQRAIGVSEVLLDPALLDDFHNYTIEWRGDSAVFAVDDKVVMRAPHPASDALGFIAWIDNQYAIVTPQGKFGHGLLDISQAQSLRLRDLQITPLP